MAAATRYGTRFSVSDGLLVRVSQPEVNHFVILLIYFVQ